MGGGIYVLSMLSSSQYIYIYIYIYIHIYIYTHIHMGVVPSTGDDNLGTWIYPGVENVTADWE